MNLGVPALVVTIGIFQHQHGINGAGLICELAQFTHGLSWRSVYLCQLKR